MSRLVRVRAFTLIEMLVVITIIGLLASMVLVSFGKFKDKAREVECVNNLKNLHSAFAIQTDDWLVSGARLNCAGQYEYDNGTGLYHWRKGWVNRFGAPATLPGNTRANQRRWWSRGTPSGWRESDNGIWAITNGHLYAKAQPISMKIFVCPTFEKYMKDSRGVNDVVRSYNMSLANHWRYYNSIASDGVGYARYLLFTEMGITNTYEGSTVCLKAIYSGSAAQRAAGGDGVFECTHWNGGRPRELSGRYHPGGIANAVFMDGHVEKITYNQATNAAYGHW